MNIQDPIICDIETDGLLDTLTKLHVFSLCYFSKDTGKYEVFSIERFDDIQRVVGNPDNVVLGHNFFLFDIPALQILYPEIEINATIIDSLFLSWYLEPSRLKEGKKHGLESYGEDFGVPKPEIEDWVGLSYEEYKNRCETDTKINTNLWYKQYKKLEKLYEDEDRIESFLRFLMTKGKVYQMHLKNPIRLDVEACQNNLDILTEYMTEREDKLKEIMPKVPVKSKRNRPKNMYKKDGTLSSLGEKWHEFLMEQGLSVDHKEEVEYIRSYDEPKPTSVSQVKDWLFSLGWKPDYFVESITRNGTNKVPQVKDKDKNLCKSVMKLAKDYPAIEELEDLGVIMHRMGYLKSFLENHRDGNLVADIAGLTNTLRIRHRTLVNLPKPSMNYGEYIRSVLLPPEGHIMIGSDLSGLESTTRNNFVIDLDPKFVSLQDHPHYDPHLEIAVIAGMMSEGESDFYKLWKAYGKDGGVRPEDITDNTEDLLIILKSYPNKDERDNLFHKLDKIRHNAKTTNYSAMYGVGAHKLSKELEISTREAKTLINAYWKKNWSVKHFASRCKTKTVGDQQWVLNPLNKYWYSLRNEKDIFSTVNQSAGDYIFTLWQHNLMNMGVTLRGGFHDEIITTCLPEDKDEVIEKLYKAIDMVNRQLKLKVPVGIDHKVGNDYSQVH